MIGWAKPLIPETQMILVQGEQKWRHGIAGIECAREREAELAALPCNSSWGKSQSQSWRSSPEK